MKYSEFILNDLDLTVTGVAVVLKFLKFQSCPEFSTLSFWSVCENVLKFALDVTLH